MKFIQRSKTLLLSAFFFLFYTLPALAVDNPQIGTGLDSSVDQAQLADKFLKVSTGVGALIGAVCVGVLIYNGFRLTTATNEKTRAEVKEHIVYAFGGIALVAFALVIVGFVTNILSK
ncbi:MAG: hypothetical protein HPY50_02210 [Firmicutes bacterium]|nr:hypothetical protein [Bacillota bacterium]